MNEFRKKCKKEWEKFESLTPKEKAEHLNKVWNENIGKWSDMLRICKSVEAFEEMCSLAIEEGYFDEFAKGLEKE